MDKIKESLITVARSLDSERKIDTDLWKMNLMELGMNSIEYIKFIVAVEENLGMDFPDQLLDLNEFNTFEKIENYIKELIKANK